MRLTTSICLSVFASLSTCGGEWQVSAFSLTAGPRSNSRRALSLQRFMAATTTATTAGDDILTAKKTAARRDLIETAERLRDEFGIILIDKQAKQDLKAVVENLEAVSEPPVDSTDPLFLEQFIGDWTLICTTSVSQDGIDTSKLPFLSSGPLKDLRDAVRKAANKNLSVYQLIRVDETTGLMNRVDHVIEYQPPNKLSDISLFQGANLPEQISSINVNPLDVSKSKLVLIHKAAFKNDNGFGSPVKTELKLSSVVLNVAGTSTMLDPAGKDVLGVNVPLAEFQAGTFETVYLDDEVRISRGKAAGGLLEQLRVFIKTEKYAQDLALQDIQKSKNKVGSGVDAELDVDDIADSDFVASSGEEPNDDGLAPSDVSDSGL